MKVANSLCVAVLIVGSTTLATAGPPVGWRNDGTGKFQSANPPSAWGADKNIAWRVQLTGRSLASPVVVGERVFVMAEPAELVCLSATNGEVLWKRSHQYVDVFGIAEGERIEKDLAQARKLQDQANQLNRKRDEARKANDEKTQKELEQQINVLREQAKKLQVFRPMPGGDTGNTGSTPTSDGKNVFAVFGTGIVSSHSLSGERNWLKFIEAPSSDQSASPVLVDGKLIIQLRKLVALDSATGEVIWKAETGARHGSPVVTEIGGTQVVITPGGSIVRVADGRIVAKNQFRLNHASPIVHAGVVYAMQDERIKAVTITNASADSAVTQVAWESDGSRASRLASPILHNGLLYSVTEQGILEVTDAKNGKRVYRKRLEFKGGRVDPSLSLAGDRIYISNTRGATVIVRPGSKYEEIARCQLDDGFSSSLAFSSNRLYVRTPKHVYCIAEPIVRTAGDTAKPR